MGSGQSSHATGKQQSLAADETSQHATDGNISSSSTGVSYAATKPKNNDPPQNESGYARATRICQKKKLAYDRCYTAQLSSKEEDCNDLFETYRTCFLRIMSKDMERRGIKVSENSMIGEYKEEVAEEDDDR